MTYELFVSLRYLRAKRKQTFISVISFISIAGVTLGVAALIVVLAVMTGFHDGVRQQILGNIPHVLIQRHGENLAGYQEITASVRDSSPHIVAAAPFVNKEVMLLSRQNVAAVSARGIAPGNKILRQPLLTLDGRPAEGLLFDSAPLPGIVIALDTAAALGVTVGDTINVIPPLFNITPFGMIPKMKAFRVVGIIQQRGGFIDTYFAYIALAEAQRFFGLGDEVSGIEIEVDNFDRPAPWPRSCADSTAFRIRFARGRICSARSSPPSISRSSDCSSFWPLSSWSRPSISPRP